MGDFVLILGATSSIARHAAAALARRGRPLFLAARDAVELERMAADLRIRYGASIACEPFDAEDYDNHGAFFEEVLKRSGGLAGVVLTFGYLGEQERAARDFRECERVIARNFTGAVSVLNLCADYLESRRGGFVVAVSSVAGDVGRQSNYLYGAAKAGLNVYLQGLRNRLHLSGVRVVTIKPGFVDTPMTFGRPRLFLVASPRTVGERIARAAERGNEVVYVPWFWHPVMLTLRLLPERLRKRMKL
jgi:short-subunit dehydrogenase